MVGVCIDINLQGLIFWTIVVQSKTKWTKSLRLLWKRWNVGAVAVMAWTNPQNTIENKNLEMSAPSFHLRFLINGDYDFFIFTKLVKIIYFDKFECNHASQKIYKVHTFTPAGISNLHFPPSWHVKFNIRNLMREFLGSCYCSPRLQLVIHIMPHSGKILFPLVTWN